jgi:hypothetical protein
MVVRGRQSRKWIIRSLRDKQTAKGAPPPPENKQKSLDTVLKHFGAGVVGSSDAAPNLLRAFRLAAVPAPRGAVHQRNEFTPVVKLLKSKLPPDAVRTLRMLASGRSAHGAKRFNTSRKAVIEGARHFWLVGGDNGCEAVIMSLKKVLRRTNLLGTSGGDQAQVNLLYAARMAKSPGFKSTLQALADYRKAMTGVTGPLQAFNTDWFKFVG